MTEQHKLTTNGHRISHHKMKGEKKEIAFSNSSTTIKVGVVNPRGQQRWKPLAD